MRCRHSCCIVPRITAVSKIQKPPPLVVIGGHRVVCYSEHGLLFDPAIALLVLLLVDGSDPSGEK